MPTGNQSRSDTAPREATPRLAIPSLKDARILEGVTPFGHADGDAFADQGFAVLDLLAASFHTSEAVGPEGVIRNGLLHVNLLRDGRHSTIAQALEAVTSLFALARHFDDVSRAEQNNLRLDQMEGR
ncbi:MAG: hypothetical protein WBL20_19210 [Sphingobium sp.]|uniref:hypothetical protein n=1 Tax=Sphingobium sp. TaxID=1912891 RepID=UPI003BB1D3D1